jgi:hypothetical protein
MQNAKTELLEALQNRPKLKCAIIRVGYSYGDKEKPSYKLKTGYSKTDLETFLNSLDFEYNSGYGGQELYGGLWLKDGTWFDRGEYDGSEWWQYQVCPDIPADII